MPWRDYISPVLKGGAAMTIANDRDRAVAAAVDRIRAIEETDGVNPGALGKM